MLVNPEITFSLFEEEELDDRLSFATDGQFSDLTADIESIRKTDHYLNLLKTFLNTYFSRFK